MKNNPEKVLEYRKKHKENYSRMHPIAFEKCAVCGETKRVGRLCSGVICAHKRDRDNKNKSYHRRMMLPENRERRNDYSRNYARTHKKQPTKKFCEICNAEIYRRTFCETCAKNRRALAKKKLKSTPDYKLKHRVYYRAYQKQNDSKCKSWSVASKSKMRNKLGDSYIKKLLTQNTSLSYGDIPKELVELKRKQLEAVRLLKEQE